MPPGSGKLDGMFPGIYRPVCAHMHGFFDISSWGVRIVIIHCNSSGPTNGPKLFRYAACSANIGADIALI